MPDTATLAKIHIAKKELAMDDDAYRALLQNIARVASAKDLTPVQAGRVLDHMKQCGWKPKNSKKTGKRPNPPSDKAALICKIEAQLTEAKRPWAYADGMAKHMFGVDKVDWCELDQLKRIVAALAYDAKRNGRSA